MRPLAFLLVVFTVSACAGGSGNKGAADAEADGADPVDAVSGDLTVDLRGHEDVAITDMSPVDLADPKDISVEVGDSVLDVLDAELVEDIFTDLGVVEETFAEVEVVEEIYTEIVPDVATGQEVGPDGGTFEGPEGMEVEVPAGAVEEPLVVDIAVTEGESFEVEQLGLVFAFTPHGTEFQEAITVTVPYDAPADGNLEGLALYWSDSADGPWSPLPGGYDETEGVVWGETTHFSYGFAGRPGGGCGESLVINHAGDAVDHDLTDGICDYDEYAEGSQCTLRAAIEQANACPGPDLITVAAGDGPMKLMPATQLPAIYGKLSFEGSLIPGAADVVIDGSNAGFDKHGLRVFANEVVIAGVRIINFDGDAIHANIGSEGVLWLHNLELEDNCGWGVWSSGFVRLGTTDTLGAEPGQHSLIKKNGEAVGCLGGGILAWDSGAWVAGAEISYNGAQGILTNDNLIVISVYVHHNEGDGLRSEVGSVTVQLNEIDNQPVKISSNDGHGIYAGGDCDDENGCVAVDATHPINVSYNAGWGIWGNGTINVGTIDGVFAGKENAINANGDGPSCLILPEGLIEGDPEMEPVSCEGGGLFSPMDGGIIINGADIEENFGPGILSNESVYIRGCSVSENGADGIRTLAGGVFWGPLGASNFQNQVIDNAGHGIVSAGSYPYGMDDDDDIGIGIADEISVTGNGRWGLVSSQRVWIGHFDGVMLPHTSYVDNNGVWFDDCYVWKIMEGGKPELDKGKVPCRGGGILETGGGDQNTSWGEVLAYNLSVGSNGQTGILATGRIELRKASIGHNVGPGVHSLTNIVKVVSGDVQETVSFSSNGGNGLIAGGACDKYDECGVLLEGRVSFWNNPGWGIHSESNGVVMGQVAGVPLTTTSTILTSGGGEFCMVQDIFATGDEDPDVDEYLCDLGGGIFAEGENADVDIASSHIKDSQGNGIQVEGNVVLTSVEIEGNLGVGVQCPGDLEMSGGKICDNAEGNLEVEGEVGIFLMGYICGEDGDLCNNYFPCNFPLHCLWHPGLHRNVCTPYCLGEGFYCNTDDQCCFGLPCTGEGQATCDCLDDEAPCTGDGQCCSLVCKGGFCAQQEVGEPCQESWSCSYGLSCENGTCQDCAGPGGWCSDTCCAGLECSEQSTCCQLTGGYCYKANECCSNKCTLWACE